MSTSRIERSVAALLSLGAISILAVFHWYYPVHEWLLWRYVAYAVVSATYGFRRWPYSLYSA